MFRLIRLKHGEGAGPKLSKIHKKGNTFLNKTDSKDHVPFKLQNKLNRNINDTLTDTCKKHCFRQTDAIGWLN